jgi:hypothetical protein
MTTELNKAFAGAVQASSEAVRYDGGTLTLWREPEGGLFQTLYNAVGDLRQRLSELGLHPGVIAARDGVDSLAAFIAKGGTFTAARDSFGLDAGYYVAQACLNYDFVALGEVERIGAVAHVEPLRYYNHSPDGPSLFRAALGAGLKFSEACDVETRNAGFYVAHCGDSELIALYRQAGGTFNAPELEALKAA